MRELTIIDQADQKFAAILAGRRCSFRVRYNGTSDRWTFDLSIDDVPVLYGRGIVTDVDLIEPFSFGIGAIFAAVVTEGAAPDRTGLPAGTVKLYHATEAEIAAALA